MGSFANLCAQYRQQEGKELFTGSLLCLDPGETTGWISLECSGDYSNYRVVGRIYGQIACNPIETAGIPNLVRLFEEAKPTKVVYEEYRVYSWKSATHSWAELHTPQFIGTIRTIASIRGIPVASHMAQQAKQFVTDDKLQDWDFYVKGQKHCRDATRHGLLYLMFTH